MTRTAPRLDADRAARAARAIVDGDLHISETGAEGVFTVRSFSGNGVYIVSTTDGFCTCPDSKYRPRRICKHRIALALREGLES